jgi:Fe-S cluster biogenesis protein NfuA/nitrite reductase/ring-hydroxylating ferredoxin subunit
MEFDQAVAELNTLVGTLEREGDERALLLLELVDAIHRPGLERIAAGDLDHPVAWTLLAMYDLVPVDERIEVEEALDEVRPYIESHGGELELLDVQDGVVHVRMAGSCHGCAASAVTLRRGIEETLRAHVPGFKEVVAHEPEDAGGAGSDGGGLLQIAQVPAPAPAAPDGGLLQIAGLRRPVFADAGPIGELPDGTMKAVDVGGRSILLVNLGGEPYAFQNVCPVDGRLPLDGGRLTGSVLVCPWHNCAYDARSGKRADDSPDEPALAVVPIAVSEGMLQVAANVA